MGLSFGWLLLLLCAAVGYNAAMSILRLNVLYSSYAKPSDESRAALQALQALRDRLTYEIQIDEYQRVLANAMAHVERYARSVRHNGRDLALEDYRLIMTYYSHALDNWEEEITKGKVGAEYFRNKVFRKWQAASDWIDVTIGKFNLRY
jgi:hypothetical protein